MGCLNDWTLQSIEIAGISRTSSSGSYSAIDRKPHVKNSRGKFRIDGMAGFSKELLIVGDRRSSWHCRCWFKAHLLLSARTVSSTLRRLAYE